MVYWSSLAAISLAISLVLPSAQADQQFPLFDQKIHLKKDALDHAHKLLRHNPLIDTHNDLPM
jgi:membrane dipeptidase